MLFAVHSRTMSHSVLITILFVVSLLLSSRNSAQAQMEFGEQFLQQRTDTIKAMAQLGLAMRLYTGDHNGQYAKTLDEIKVIFGDDTHFYRATNTFELVNAGLVYDSMTDKLILREIVPRKNPAGKWERVYCLLDGTALNITSPDGNFDAYEKPHLVSPEEAAQAATAAVVSDQPRQGNVPSQERLNVFAATNLDEWTNALPELHRLNPSKYEESWILEECNPDKQRSVRLAGKDGDHLTYPVSFVDVRVKPGGHIRQVELQSPSMNIDEIRKFGLRLCDLLSIDENGLRNWCNQVGNNWVDQPLFYSGAGISPNPGKAVAFNIRRTFNNEKPWYIDFVYTDNSTAAVEQNGKPSSKAATQANPVTIRSNPSKLLNAITAQNIEEWTNSIPNLIKDRTLKGNWTMWQAHTNPGVPLILSYDQNSVEFHTGLINIFTRKDGSGNLSRIEMQSTWMNIADTRTLGDELLHLMGKDQVGFDAWCDKTSEPFYSSGNSQFAGNDKYYGFAILRSYNRTNPWIIYFVISDK
ncbi:MAG TPA: hypothetical protein VKV04_08660 [Verrucomicrobiae bacterium]|nr:hypothetical protein [Verrucomicrobiae bacterium]